MICLPVMEPHQQPLATLQITVTGKKILEIDQYRLGMESNWNSFQIRLI